MENLIGIFLNSVFTGNILLAYFLGMCSFVAVSKNIDTAIGLGFAVVFVLTVTTPVNWLIIQLSAGAGGLILAGVSQSQSQLSEIHHVHCGHRGHGPGHRDDH